MNNIHAALFASVVIILSTSNLGHAQDYVLESVLVTIFADGKAFIEYRLTADETVPTLTVPLFGKIYEQLITVDKDNLLLENRIENGTLVVETFGASSIFITYTTPDLVNKIGNLWTFVLDSPIDTSIRLPNDSVIIGLNQIPTSIKLSEDQYILIMPEGHSEISYVIGAVGTKEHANIAIREAEKAIADYGNEGIVVSGAETKLNEAKEAFDSGKYADAEILADDAKSIANNASHNASLASDALSEAETAIKENEDQGFDISTASQLFTQAGQEFVKGNYSNALSLAQQAKAIAMDTRNIVTKDSPDQTFVIAAVIGASAAGAAGAAVYMRSRTRISIEKTAAGIPTELVVRERRIIDLERIFAQKPYLRDDDKETISYISEKGGEVFESEIRDKFDLPKTTVWRLVKRLEREELVEVKKAGGQNLIRIREEFTRTDQNSVAK
ncbi:MAG: helix-turn-helix transcriptional regulator [Nitrososphaerales archaeon]